MLSCVDFTLLYTHMAFISWSLSCHSTLLIYCCPYTEIVGWHQYRLQATYKWAATKNLGIMNLGETDIINISSDSCFILY